MKEQNHKAGFYDFSYNTVNKTWRDTSVIIFNGEATVKIPVKEAHNAKTTNQL